MKPMLVLGRPDELNLSQENTWLGDAFHVLKHLTSYGPCNLVVNAIKHAKAFPG